MPKLRYKGVLFFLFFLAGFLCSGTLWAEASLSIQKGPYLLLKSNELLVRVEEKNLKAPRLEWKLRSESRSLPMLPVRGDLWEGRITATHSLKSYQVVEGDASTGWIPIAGLNPKAKSLRFVAYGDNRSGYGKGETHEQILQQVRLEQPSFILNTGDVVFRGNNELHWNSYFKEGRGVFDRVLQFPAMGNHDRSRKHRFAELFPLGRQDANYYAFRYGPAYFIVLDSTESYRRGSKQYNFLKQELEAWHKKLPIIISLHHPPFSTGKHGSTRQVIKYLVPLFENYGVAVVLAGHDHNYQRIGPINGVLYIVTGGGGGPLYKFAPHPFVKNAQREFHYLLFEIKGDHLLGWMKNKVGVVVDEFDLKLTLTAVPREKREQLPKLPNSRFRFFH